MSDSEEKVVLAPESKTKFIKHCDRKNIGSPPTWSTSDELWESAKPYFEWVEKNPIYAVKAFHTNGEITYASVPKMRAMSIKALCVHLGITDRGYYKFKKRKKDDNTPESDKFVQVFDAIEQIMHVQKFEGSAAGQLNANVICRDLGLKDGLDLTSSDNSMSPKGLQDFYSDVNDQ